MLFGIVNIQSHDKDHILVHVYEKYRHPDLVDMKTFSSGVTTRDGVVTVISESPAFNFHSCQHSKIEIYIPKKYHSISFTGFVKNGYINFHGLYTSPVGNVDMVVELGYIKINNLNAKSLSLLNKFGVISLTESIIAHDVNLQGHTGAIHTNFVISKEFFANLKYGCSRLLQIVADKIEVNTNMGYSYVSSSPFTTSQKIAINNEYGRSTLRLYHSVKNFTIESKRGKNILSYEDKSITCHGFKNRTTSSLLSGSCNFKNTKGSESEVSIKTNYGESKLIVEMDVVVLL